MFSTLNELIAFQASEFKSSELFHFRQNNQWQKISSQEFLEKSFHFACGLKEIGFEKNQLLAIVAYQNPLWLIADFGCMLAGGATVPIFYNISNENLIFEIEDSGANFIFCDNSEVASIIKDENIKIISCDEKSELTFEGLISMGQQAAAKYDLNSFIKNKNPQDLATIIYTSGSTGQPKGVELTHENLVSQIKATAICFKLQQSDKALSFLPLAHIFERMVMMFYITQGIKIYFVDDLKNLPNLLQEISPNLMTVVPRVLEKLFHKIEEAVENSNFFKKSLARNALHRALTKAADEKDNFFDKIYQHFIYKKFRAVLGKNMRMIICGGAALSEEMELFYKNIGVDLYCGYGLTECSPVLAVNFPTQRKFASIGKAFPFVELKIAADSELLARGPNIMRGYHNQIEKTRETFIDGWFKTGDLANIDAEGFVKIIGRKKELFKTANGKYVSPVPIEQKLMREIGFLTGAIIIAEGRKFTSALLFPDLDLLKKVKTQFKFNATDDEFLSSEILNKFVASIITRINQSLDHAEQIQKFKIVNAKISIETGEITPSMKLKRNIIEEKFRGIIDEFYRE